MGKLERITVTMPEEMAARLRAAVDSGAYASTSEVVREALRGWGDAQEKRGIALQSLRAAITEALADEPLDGIAAMAELREKYRVE